VIRLAVRVQREHAEIVLADLMAFAPGGLEERDVDGDTIEYVLYGAEGELPELGEVRAVAGAALVDVSTTRLPDGWGEDWRSFHKPVDVRGLRVRPPWEPPREGALDVVIDPGQAFGTGSHATTQLTLELLAELEPVGALADWGCGSGVLAIAAAKLGWSPVLACDVEVESVEAARAGAIANGVSLEVTRCDVRQGGPYAPTVLANLVRPLLLEVAANLQQVPERLIISGLEGDEPAEVVPAFACHGLLEVARREGNNWSAIELRRT
jgi:ribosomal protein L11 methyltransferase